MINYNDYRTHLKICEFLGKEPTGQFKKVYDYLTGMWDGMEIVVNAQTNRIIFQKGGNWFFRHNLETGYLWCNYEYTCSFFENDMGMNNTDTEGFIKTAVEEHLKCEVGTPGNLAAGAIAQVEEHLKCEVGTPPNFLTFRLLWVEEQLKYEVVTPQWDLSWMTFQTETDT